MIGPRFQMMTEQQPRAGRLLYALTMFLAVVVVTLHSVSIAAPTGANWGFHFFAFFPVAVGISGAAAMALLLLPFCQERVLRLVEFAHVRWSSFPLFVRRTGGILGLIAAGVLFWILRERTLLLGDGGLVVRSLEESQTPGNLSTVFRTAPLSGLAAWSGARLAALFGCANPAESAWRMLSVLAGVGGVLLSARLARELASESLNRLLVFLFIITAGTSQLYFGYVETYPLAYLISLGFLAASLSWIRTRKGITLVILLFVLMTLAHVTLALFFPGLLLLFWKGKGIRALLPGCLLAGAAAAAVLWSTGFTLAKVTALGDLPGSTLLPFLSADGSDAPYALISIWHLTDVLNLVFLIAPFALPPILLIGKMGVSVRTDVSLQFLILLSIAGGLWLVVTHFTIGFSRDWDVAAVSTLGWVALGGALWTRGGGREVLRLFAALMMVAGIHTAAWIGTNADQARSMRRFESLYTEHLWTTHAGTYAFEDLSAFSRNRKDFFPAMLYSAKALALDSTNPRRWLHFAGAAQLAGWDDRAIPAYERGLKGPLAGAGHFRDLARLYVRNDRMGDAIRILDSASVRFPGDAATLMALGELVAAQGGDPERALRLFRGAAQLDPGIPEIEERIRECERLAGTRR